METKWVIVIAVAMLIVGMLLGWFAYSHYWVAWYPKDCPAACSTKSSFQGSGICG